MTEAPPLLWRPLSKPQAAFVSCADFECMYGGAKGGAKTESLVVAPLQQVGHARFKGLLLREQWDELKEIHDRCKHYYAPLGARFHGGDSRWTFPSGGTIEIGYLRDESDLDRYQGREWTYVGFDELGNLRDEIVWARMLAEIRSPDPTLVRMARGSANPGGKGHAWLKHRFVVQTEYGQRLYRDPATGLSRRFIPSKVTDNPIYANDAQYMAVLRGLPETQRRQLLDGDWDAGEGMALEELSRPIHMPTGYAQKIPDWWYQWGALDIGFGHCWCFIWGAMDPSGRAYVCDSLHGQRDRYDEVARRIVEQVPAIVLKNVVCDNYARQEGSRGHRDRTPSVMELFSEYGIHMAEANQRRVLGLNNLRLWLGWRLADGKQKTPRLRFFDTPGNRITFDCLERMVVDPRNVEDVLKVHADAQGRGGDDPYDTCLAGDTLVRTARGWERIDSLVGTRGKCLTPRGWLRYNKVRQTRLSAPHWRLDVGNRQGVTATADHEILTPSGWRQLGHLRPGDECLWVAAADSSEPHRAAVSGPHLSAAGDWVLPLSTAFPASRSVGSELRSDPSEASDPSPGWRSDEQSAGEFGRAEWRGAFQGALDARTAGASASAHCGDSADDEGVARLARGPRVAQPERDSRDSDAATTRQEMRAVWEGVPLDSEARALLPSELQDDSAQAPTRYRAARVHAIYEVGTGPVYNMEVEDVHCFAVNGGLVVHNCRYLMAAHPYTPIEPHDPTAAFEPDRDTMPWPAPNHDAPDDDPNPETIGGLSYGF